MKGHRFPPPLPELTWVRSRQTRQEIAAGTLLVRQREPIVLAPLPALRHVRANRETVQAARSPEPAAQTATPTLGGWVAAEIDVSHRSLPVGRILGDEILLTEVAPSLVRAVAASEPAIRRSPQAIDLVLQADSKATVFSDADRRAPSDFAPHSSTHATTPGALTVGLRASDVLASAGHLGELSLAVDLGVVRREVRVIARPDGTESWSARSVTTVVLSYGPAVSGDSARSVLAALTGALELRD